MRKSRLLQPAAMVAGLLAPYSDIDLLFILPYKQTPWSESVAEYMLYLLWGSGAQSRSRNALGFAMREPIKERYDDPDVASGCALSAWR